MKSQLKFYITYIISSLFLFACETNLPSEELENSTEEFTSKVLIEEETPEWVPSKNFEEIYTGKLGVYQAQVVMQLTFSDEKITGTYYYTKHQKKLNLEGNIDYYTGKITMMESYKNKVTGYLEGTLVDNEISGIWKAKKNDENTQKFNVSLLQTSEDNAIIEEVRFSKYILEHSIELYDSDTEDWQSMSTTDVIKVNSFTDNNFDFYYSITGTNGHTGSIEGIGTMQTESIGQFKDGEGCELRFAFFDDSLSIEAEGCENYAGARAYFGGTLRKK